MILILLLANLVKNMKIFIDYLKTNNCYFEFFRFNIFFKTIFSKISFILKKCIFELSMKAIL